MLCLAGEVSWARLSTPRVLKLGSSTPVALVLREHAELWLSLRTPAAAAPITDDARTVLGHLEARGASFFGDLTAALRFDADRLRHTIGILVAAGLAVSDGFSGLRLVMAGVHGRSMPLDRRRNFAGRWAALSGTSKDEDRETAIECQARVLLRRYGVIFRRLLAREQNAAPWRELARVYRRLEARGEIRGGRFVSGMAGEQYALSDAVTMLREVRRSPADGRLVTISTADPLNLTGIVTAGDRVRVGGRNRMAYRDGVPLGVMEGQELRMLAPLDRSEIVELTRALLRPRAVVRA